MTRYRRRRELIALAALGIGIAAFLAGRFWLQHITPQLGLFCLAVSVPCFFFHLWVAGAGWALIGAIGVSAIVQNYLPRFSAPRPGCSLTVVTFNMLAEPPDDVGAAKLLAGLRSDVIFAQKVYDNLRFRDALLAEGFSGYHSFPSPTKPDLILSRFPIVRSDDDRNGIWVDIVVEGREVRLQNMYAPRATGAWPGYDNGNWPGYRDYYARLVRQVRDQHLPLILAGDGNATQFAPEVRELRGLLQDAWDEAGFGLGATFPGPWRRTGVLGPWLRIDYVFHNGAFDAIAARRVDAATGAGHYPVLAELVFAGAGSAGTRCD